MFASSLVFIFMRDITEKTSSCNISMYKARKPSEANKGYVKDYLKLRLNKKKYKCCHQRQMIINRIKVSQAKEGTEKVACVASVSVGFGSKERPRNGVFGILPARKMGREPKKEWWG